MRHGDVPDVHPSNSFCPAPCRGLNDFLERGLEDQVRIVVLGVFLEVFWVKVLGAGFGVVGVASLGRTAAPRKGGHDADGGAGIAGGGGMLHPLVVSAWLCHHVDLVILRPRAVPRRGHAALYVVGLTGQTD